MLKTKWIIILALALLAASAAWAAEQVMSVCVRQGQVRERPDFLSPVLKLLPYAQQVEVGEAQGAWRRVSAGEAVGWMHVSALSEKKIVLEPGGQAAQGGASREELALAGKGFNKDVEADFKAKNREADYQAVDNMEKGHSVSPDQIAAFLKAGGVTPPAGGGQ